MCELRRFFAACGKAAFGLLGLVSLAAPIAWSAHPEGAELLWRQAESKKLADHPYWLRLLHYPSQPPLVSEWHSEIGTPSFFLHPDGTTDPAAELRGTLAALLLPVDDTPDAHAQCRFIARFHWLRTQLDFSKVAVPVIPCERFEQWVDLEQVESLSLIFVSAYMGNPASMYGHALLRINYREEYQGRNLLAPTLSYGAMPDPEDSTPVYMIKGLAGGYPGMYADKKFFSFHHEYGETELRDMWEYQLNLTPEQQNRIVYHAWELLEGRVKFPYYFLTDNCVYRLVDLLDHAWDETRINTTWAPWRITLDAFLRLQALGNQGSLLVRQAILIPSRQRRLETRMAQLSAEERTWVARLIDDPELPTRSEFQELPGDTKSRIVDAALDYYGYRLAEKEDEEDLRSRRFELLRLRSRLPMIPQPQLQDSRIRTPTDGTPPVRIRLGRFQIPQSGTALELGIRASYHDLLGRPDGHLPYAHLATLDMRLRFHPEGAHLSQLELFRMRSFDVNLAELPQTSGLSWQTRAAFERRDLSCRPCRVLRLNFGWGKAGLWAGNTLVFGLLDGLLIAEALEAKRLALGWSPVLGIRIGGGSAWRVLVEGRYPQPLIGETPSSLDWRVEGQLTLARRWDVRLEGRRFVGEEYGVVLNYYW